MTTHTRHLAVRDALHATLAEAAGHRHERPDMIEVDGEHLPAWVFYERQQMLAAVNDWRATNGLPPADMAAITRAERQACGHIDYATKYALYCAEIACGDDQPKP